MKKLLSLPETLTATGIGRAKLYVLIGEGTFPPPVKIGRRSLWVEEEIESWISEQIELRDCKRNATKAAS